jgi:hypothetical protein
VTDLKREYTTEIDSLDAGSWYLHLDRFADASIYQTWPWGVVFSGSNRVSHLVLKRSGMVVALAQVRLFKTPLVPGGIAFVRWGPVWQPRSGEKDPEVFRQAIRALRNEYVVRGKMVLRILPRLFERDGDCGEILEQEGFFRMEDRSGARSLILDLSPPLEEIRSGFEQKWRGHLNKAERQGLSMSTGRGEVDFEDFTAIYKTMLRRKKLTPTSDLEGHKRVQRELPERFKMEVVTCRYEDELCAGGIFSLIGETGLYLFGATNEKGMRTSASYLVQWELVKLLKERGVSQYDLHGVNPESNPGTYRFKKGLAGKTGVEVEFLGQFQAVTPSIANYSVLAIDAVRHRVRRLRTGAR